MPMELAGVPERLCTGRGESYRFSHDTFWGKHEGAANVTCLSRTRSFGVYHCGHRLNVMLHMQCSGVKRSQAFTHLGWI